MSCVSHCYPHVYVLLLLGTGWLQPEQHTSSSFSQLRISLFFSHPLPPLGLLR